MKFPVEDHNTLIVRKADKHLWRLFEDGILNADKKIGRYNYRAMLILGPEGTGKVRSILKLFHILAI
jgi:hypothetical protein